ncbi:methyl-accepting chemotaxis protein [Larsenimonas salina]|uniref:methyl-accepting chemotaxis protein n=1 Tax=Larsenimonas salina TaxID=1295565 RepID=UPI002074566F|nr:methyl-accepting chemotaxis protein [Larsenimonas salina]MCM5704385.1 methyl-accepting chemotaxis protein [Larsenimonas salina]
MIKLASSVKTRLIATLAVGIVFMIGIGIAAEVGLQANNADASELYDVQMQKQLAMAEVRTNLLQVRIEGLAAFGYRDETRIANLDERVEELKVKSQDAWQHYQSLASASGNTSEQLGQLERNLDQFWQGYERVTREMQAGNFDLVDTIGSTVISPAYRQFIELTNGLVASDQQRMSTAYQAGQARYDVLSNSILVAILLAVGLSVVLAVWLIRSIVRPLSEAQMLADAIASGDLTRQVSNHRRDEFGRMLESMREMQNRLTDIVGNVREGADSVYSAVAEISNGNDDLSARTQEQAASLEQTAASMDQMTSTVKQNGDSMRSMSELATGMSGEVRQGSAMIGRTREAMAEINDSSSRIENIVGLIDSIAFQTNLLALNASVEAARAGEQGRGFAVVASEVRNLATRSADAATEIRDLVAQNVDKARNGVELVEQSERILSNLLGRAGQVNGLVSEIESATREQISGIEQVNQAVAQMDSATQQNAALVEESAAAGHSLKEQADELSRQVAIFTLNKRSNARPAPTHGQVTSAPLPVSRPAPHSHSKAATSSSSGPVATKKAPRAAEPVTADDSDWETF